MNTESDNDIVNEDAEIESGELVHLPTSDGEHAHVERAISAAAQAALDEPGIPGVDEIKSIALMAKLLSGSDLAPKEIRQKPYNAFMVLLTGRALGLDPTAAMRKVYIVDGQPSLAPQLTAALVRRQGLGRIARGVVTPHVAEAWPLGPGGVDSRCSLTERRHVDDCRCDIMGDPIEFTWRHAQNAGLVDQRCSGDGTHIQSCQCKSNWKNYPERMLWWRAVGYCADDYFPEVALGLYSPDELGSMTDADGTPIDPATAELPKGFDDTAEERAAAEAARNAPGPPEDVEWVQTVLGALDADVLERVKAAWMNSVGGGKLDVIPGHLLTKGMRLIRGMVKDADEIYARSTGDETTPEAPESAANEPEASTEPEPAPEQETAPERPALRHANEDPHANEIRGALEVARDMSDDVLLPGIDATITEMHHATVRRELRERGEPRADEFHIDTARMALTILLIEEAMADE